MAVKPRSRQLVVDACVLQSAGETNHPVSSKCRKTLNDILSICHHAVVDDRLCAEWRRHASHRSKKWWGTMQRRGKIDKAPPSVAGIRLKGISKKDRAIIEKDRMLVDIADGTDKIIITQDHTFMGALRRTGNERYLDDIRWFDPVVAPEDYLYSL